MAREVKLSHVESMLGELSYPIARETAASEFEDVTLLLADGERNLGELIADVPAEEFESNEELQSEINNVLPREAVGEPYQSEGEG
ncbi:hypothetical protein M0R89_12050 [Halorussus limi]|uniref:DUF2795 domain-containing protein n=1 Tax=Halorussus limi TaxID=2938695 RepID=A0A8U0HRB2_9EURY|nr:hypothetical protein [Halorussus limi]UPV73276.1 hypothetical protein M0R89_12050 [Halorussus limi]